MALCTGERKYNRLDCNGTLYKCECGHEGCKQNKAEACSNQAFDVYGKCLKCGTVGKYSALSNAFTDHAPRKTPAFL